MKLIFALLLGCMPVLGADISSFRSISVTQTNYSKEVIVTNGLTLGGVRNTAWPAGGTVGTLVNTTATTAGQIVKFTDTSKTNTAPSTALAEVAGTNVTVAGSASANTLVATNGITSTGSIQSTVGNNPSLTLRSGGAGSYTFLDLGRTSSEGNVGVSGGAGQFFTESAAGDVVVKASSGANKMFLGTGNSATIGIQNGAPGVIDLYGATVQRTSLTITNGATGTVPLTINHASGATAHAFDANTGGQLNAFIGANGMVTSRKAFQQYTQARTQAGTMNLDFDGAATKDLITLTGAVTFTFSNLATNRVYTLYLNGVSTNATITWPAGVIGVYPTVVPSAKVVRCDLESWSDNATNVWISGTTSN